MSEKLTAMIAMRPDLVASVLPEPLMARLSATARIERVLAATDFAEPEVLHTLAGTDVLITGWGCPVVEDWVLDAAPKLRAVVHAAGSVKELVSPTVWDRGVLVSSAAAVNALPVAQYTVSAVLLAGKRAFRLANEYTSTGFRDYSVQPDTGNHGRTVGVVGASRTGRLVLAMLAGHGFRLLVSDPTITEAQAAALVPDGRVELVELDDLLIRSDVVTVHAPLLPGTRGLLDARRLALLPDHAVLVNTARGALIDTEALVAECASGRIDAVLDVTDPEPLPHGHPLLTLPNVLVTPHVAGAMGSEVSRLGEFAVAEVERLAAGLPLLGLVAAEELATTA
ncbi:hydroxyacid dehydrogenase [Streptacidiphilus sp. N1-10]|uniref:Hydroxyacid dehydrogenase n=1 Tax=Streptacidiphilus jeojiensis TaxID=3229225 RepID=A0ABV6XKZ5_9ACTN